MVGIVRNSKHLEEVRKDVFQAFEHYQFGIKEYFMSDRQGEPVVTSFLGNYWRVGMRGKIDQVKPKLYFSIHERYFICQDFDRSYVTSSITTHGY